MARSRKKAAPSRRSGGGDSGSAGAKSAPRKPRATVDVVEEEGGLGLEEGLVFFTTLMLVVAFFLIDKELGGYGKGLFFK